MKIQNSGNTHDLPTKAYARAEYDQESGRNATHKLTRQMQFEVCVMIAHGYSDRHVARQILKKYLLQIDWTTINQTYRNGKKWRKTITYLREKYLKNISRRPCMQKVWRLKTLEDAMTEAIEGGNLKVVASIHSSMLDEVEGRQKIELKQVNNTTIFKDATKAAESKNEQELMQDLNTRFSEQWADRK